MNLKKKLLTVFILLLMLFPTTALAYSSYVIPGGDNVGIRLNSKQVMIVGFYKVNGNYIGEEAGLKVGDRITHINDQKVDSIDSMVKIIDKDCVNEKLNIKFLRENKEKNTVLSITKDENNIYKTGLYVKDQINGIGTLSYIDPNTKIYGALGHEIIDKSSAQKVEVKDGTIFKSTITGIVPSVDGEPGEKNARFYNDDVYGTIFSNEESGIFGNYQNELPNKDAIEVGKPEDVKLGSAYIKTVVDGEKVEQFEIKILEINKTTDTKNILFEVTDERLLKKTGGVVAGMSGSPIIQDNKLVGAVTHVIVNKANKGYGIFITTMLKEGEKTKR